MKKKLLLFAALIALAGLSSAFTVSLTTNRVQEPKYTKMYKDMKTYDEEWAKVDSLNSLRLPESARAIIDKIYEDARLQNNVPQFLKAFVYRLNADAMKEEHAFVKSSKEIEAVIEKAACPAKNILHSIAANMYWQYYQQNRWQFHDRTQTETPGSDIDTWDLRTIVDKVVAHYSASLEQPELLQTISVTSFDPILYTDLDSEKYRPTLFDLLAFRAADFYRTNEAGLTQPADFFSLSDEKYFAAAADFANRPITTTDSLSFKYRALLLYRQIIAFHLHDADPTALIDADMQRLDFVYNHTTLEEKDSLYLAALQAMDRQWSAYPISTEILFRIARLYNQQGDAYHPFTNAAVQWKKKEAMTVIETAVQRFRNSFGAQNCIRLKEGIERPGLTLVTDEAALPDKPILVSLRYNNVPKVYYKIVALDYKEMLKRVWNNGYTAFYSKQKAVRQGEFTLPTGNDYQPHTVELALPELREGYYAILLSNDGQFEKIFSANEIWATNLSYTTQQFGGEHRVMALHRESGQPLAGVQVQTFIREYNYNSNGERYVVKYGKTYITDAEGTVVLKGTTDNYHSKGFVFVNGEDRYTTSEMVYLYPHQAQKERAYYSTTFFTDRAIYRPGQTVYFKGIVLQHSDTDPHKTAIVPNYPAWVEFYNTNGEEVSNLRVTTNEFGSFAGSFVIPANGLTGTMRIKDNNGSVYFRVEEYKRPKFETTFQPIKGHYRLNEKITVSGNAKAYAGSAVSDAKVTYRVAREARYPFWRWWWGPMPASPAQEIVNGETVTNANGSFDINFTAIPDRTIDKKQSPIFHYTVYATVSDINGETHEAQTMVAVGYQSLLLTTDVGEKVNGDERKSIAVKATSLNGEAQPTQGTLTIWKLREPTRTLQNRRWERPDKFAMNRAAFEKLFPFSVYDNEDDVSTWKKEKQVFNLSFDTGSATNYPLRNLDKWAAGKYLLTVSAKDGFGEQVENSTIFTVFSEKQKTVPANTPVWFEVLNPIAQPGETVKILLGSAFQNVSVILETADREGNQRQVVRLNNEQRIVEIPVLEKHRGNFNAGLFFVKNNQPYSASQLISVPYDNKKLAIELATFRDKLQPGQQEEWRITIKDKQGDAVAAELLASMYDASLDAFVPHQWRFFPWHTDYIGFSWSTGTAFGSQQRGQINNSFSTASHYYDALRLPIYYQVYYSRNPYSFLSIESMKSTQMFDEVHEIQEIQMVAYPSAAEKLAMQQKDASTGSGQPEAAATAQPPVQVRTNFNETAFFYPQLKTNENGETVISFTIPEALTRWKMQGLAWTKDLKVGSITKELVTQKDLMVITNTPRFFRENDTIYFSAKLSNISDKDLQVKTTLQLSAPLAPQRGEITGELLLDKNSVQTISLKAGENKPLSWKLIIPEGLQAITYRVVATSLPLGEGRGGAFSDGEESTIPVLTNRMLVTESLPLPIRGNETKRYEFKKLINNNSATLNNHSYTIEFTSNPAWNAIQALPYIMEYPYECAEQAFSRYYANAIATHIVNSDPKIKKVFEIWKNYQPTALQSNLEKNEELKMLLLEETPWVRDAQNESERKQRIAALFDLNRMSSELSSALRKVILPEVMPGVITGAIMSFTLSIDDFVISYFTAGRVMTLSMRIFSMTRKRVSPKINAVSTLLFLIVLILLVAINIREGRQEENAKKRAKKLGG